MNSIAWFEQIGILYHFKKWEKEGRTPYTGFELQETP